MTSPDTLKPCQCGGRPVIMKDPGPQGTIVCLRCGLGYDRLGAACAIDKQIEAWNTRQPSAREAALELVLTGIRNRLEPMLKSGRKQKPGDISSVALVVAEINALLPDQAAEGAEPAPCGTCEGAREIRHKNSYGAVWLSYPCPTCAKAPEDGRA